MEAFRKLVVKFASEYTLVALVVVYGAIRLTVAPTAECLTTDVVLIMAAMAAMINGLLGE